MPRIFISHSHWDEAIAYKLVNFLLAALELEEKEILCTSNPDQGLEYGSSSINDQLKDKLKNSDALIILVTADSFHSGWIFFEAGSFWTTDKPIIPILSPGLTPNDLPGPLRNLLIIPIDAPDSEDRLNSATNQLAQKLSIQQKITRRRNNTLRELVNSLRNLKSKQAIKDSLQQREIKELKVQIQNLGLSYNRLLQEKEKSDQERAQKAKPIQQAEKLHQKQLQEIEVKAQQEWERLEKSLQSEIQQLHQQLASERNKNKLQDSTASFSNKSQTKEFILSNNLSIEEIKKTSSVQLIPSRERLDSSKRPLLIYDPDMATIWVENPQNICIHRGKTLAALRPGELVNLQEEWSSEVILVEPKDLFLPELKFIDQDDALPGALLPEIKEPLVFNNQRITPLIPLNSLLLDYLSPEALLKKITFQTRKTAEGTKIRVTLNLPLSGVKDEVASENYLLYKDYYLKYDNSLGDQLPVLQIWPYFQKAGWQEYYIFYYDVELGEQTFQITCPEANYSHSFQEGFGYFQKYRMESFPEYLLCTDLNHEPIGLILCQSPPVVRSLINWEVGVDFGTSFTNIYINSNNSPKPLKLENLQLQITETPEEARINLLFEHFIPENFIPEEKPLPLSSVLTTLGKYLNNTKMLPILDARMYIPDNLRFRPQESWMKTNLKWDWENIRDSEVFLKHLVLHITALAAKAEVMQIQWSLSYPSAFSRSDIMKYYKTWRMSTDNLQNQTGVLQICPEPDNLNYFRTESLAIAQYFADFENKDLVYSTCVDMGSGTSDISIWENNNLVHQCSVQLAGRDIFSQFLRINTNFTKQKLGLASSDWKGLGDSAFNAKLDVWLRLNSEDWLRDQRALLEEDAEFQGLVQLTTLGFAGLYYYVGILLKTLYKQGRYNRDQITPVYLGGNASRFLNWLDTRGKFDRHSEINELLSRMLSRGSSFEDAKEITHLSLNPKDEVACGLVMKHTKLTGLGRKVKDPIIAGEAYEINGTKFSADSRIDFIIDEETNEEIENIIYFKIPQLIEVPKFIYEYHLAIQDLNLESVRPLKGYKQSQEQSDNLFLWQSTQRELEKTLVSIKGEPGIIRPESTFILGLKALLRVLGKQWAEK